MSTSGIVPIMNVKGKKFDLLMSVYEEAANQVYEELIQLKENLKELYDYDIINNVTKRIKSPESIVNKMKKKNYDLNYKNLINNINDIAGIRVICPLKDNIYTVINIIKQMPNMKIINSKDYISKPKESGYSSYHLIIETPVIIEDKEIPVKVEIQLRTMAMDFWATNEHKMKYKTNKKLSALDSKKLTVYAKILNILDDKIMRLYQKQRSNV